MYEKKIKFSKIKPNESQQNKQTIKETLQKNNFNKKFQKPPISNFRKRD